MADQTLETTVALLADATKRLGEKVDSLEVSVNTLAQDQRDRDRGRAAWGVRARFLAWVIATIIAIASSTSGFIALYHVANPSTVKTIAVCGTSKTPACKK